MSLIPYNWTRGNWARSANATSVLWHPPAFNIRNLLLAREGIHRGKLTVHAQQWEASLSALEGDPDQCSCLGHEPDQHWLGIRLLHGPDRAANLPWHHPAFSVDIGKCFRLLLAGLDNYLRLRAKFWGLCWKFSPGQIFLRGTFGTFMIWRND